jgi:hypothetical protein
MAIKGADPREFISIELICLDAAAKMPASTPDAG